MTFTLRSWLSEPVDKDFIIIVVILLSWFWGTILLYNYYPEFKTIADSMTCNMVGFKEDMKPCQ